MILLTKSLVGTFLATTLAYGTMTLATITETDRGAVVRTDRIEARIENGVVVGLTNRLTSESYLEPEARLASILPHVPSGVGTQSGNAAFDAAAKLYRWPWNELSPAMPLPNQRYPSEKSVFSMERPDDQTAILTYRGLTNGSESFPDESFALKIAIEPVTSDLLITPSGRSPRAGVYASNLTVGPTAANITIEAPIFDGIRITGDMANALWVNLWPSNWDYAMVAYNGTKRGAIGVWTQDTKLRYKSLFYHVTDGLITASFSTMNTPPFDRLTESEGVTWRIQAFEKGWPEVSERYRNWREAEKMIAPRPEWTREVSLVNSSVNANKVWLDLLRSYLGDEHLSRTVSFLPVVRAANFDTRHWDNTPYATFREDTRVWKESGAKTMAYLQPMIMWHGAEPDDEGRKIIAMADRADTRSVFQKDPDGKLPHFDQHHLGEPQWQSWFLNWVDRYINEFGADGVYHDQSYPCPIDARGLVDGKNSVQGMADYFRKAAALSPDAIHGTEHLQEANSVGASLGIGGGIIWGTPPTMRMQRIRHASPISNSLHAPHAVIFAFPHFSDIVTRGDAVSYHWGHDQQERRAEIAGVFIQNIGLYSGVRLPFDTWWNELWHDRTRATVFVNHGLRPVFPTEWDANVRSYFQGGQGERFRYENTPFGSEFVTHEGGQRKVIYGRIHGVTHAATEHGIAGWAVYSDVGPSGLHPNRYYVTNPKIKRPAAYFKPAFKALPDTPSLPTFFEAYADDSTATSHFMLLRMSVLPQVGGVIKSDKIEIVSADVPRAVKVDGQQVQLPDTTTPLEVPCSANSRIAVLLQETPAGLASIEQCAQLRFLSSVNIDLFDPASLARFIKPERVKLPGADTDLPGLKVDGTLHELGSVFGTHQLNVPIRTPRGERGTLRLHMLGDGKIDSLEVDAVRHTTWQQGRPIDIPMDADETVILTINSRLPPSVAFEFVPSPNSTPGNRDE